MKIFLAAGLAAAVFFVCAVSFADNSNLFNPPSVKTLYYVWSLHDGNDTEIYYAVWDGTRWSRHNALTDNDRNDMSPAAALDKNGRLWAVWSEEDGINTSIYSRFMTDSGWSDITQVDNVDIYSDTLPSIAFDAKGTAWVTWCGTDEGQDDIYAAKWTGKRWSAPELINSPDSYPDINPVIRADKTGMPVVVWSGYNGSKYEFFFSRYTGKGWTEESPVFKDTHPSTYADILKTRDNNIDILFTETGRQYRSSLKGTKWNNPSAAETVIPRDFMKDLGVIPSGTGYITWTTGGIKQGVKIAPVLKKQDNITAGLSAGKHSLLAWIKNIFISDASADAGTTKYIAFGDSITQGYGSSKGGYPAMLEEKLNARVAPSVVVNAGVGGETTSEGANRIDGVLSENNGQYILIQEGANDITFQISAETIIFNLTQMVDKSIAYGTTPMLGSQLPRLDGWAIRVERDINPAIYQLAKDKNIDSVDLYTEMNASKEDYMIDHVHPNDTGYELIAEIWTNKINDIVNADSGTSGGGCGAVPPICKNGGGTGLYKNLFPLFLTALILLFIRRRYRCP